MVAGPHTSRCRKLRRSRYVVGATVIGAIGAGDTIEAVEDAYSLTRDQVLSAVRYAAHVAPTCRLLSKRSPDPGR